MNESFIVSNADEAVRVDDEAGERVPAKLHPEVIEPLETSFQSTKLG